MSDELREALEWVDRAVTANDGAFGPHTIEMFEVVVEAAQAHLNCIDRDLARDRIGPMFLCECGDGSCTHKPTVDRNWSVVGMVGFILWVGLGLAFIAGTGGLS